MTEQQALNEAIFEALKGPPALEKQAADAVNEFTRIKMREDPFYRRVMPPIFIGNDELDRPVDTDKPVKVVDKDPYSPFTIPGNWVVDHNGIFVPAPHVCVKDKAKDAPVAVIMNGEDIVYMAEPMKPTLSRYPRGLTL